MILNRFIEILIKLGQYDTWSSVSDCRYHFALSGSLMCQHFSRQLFKLPICLIGLEACGGVHHWVRKFTEIGHTVRMMTPQFVKYC